MAGGAGSVVAVELSVIEQLLPGLLLRVQAGLHPLGKALVREGICAAHPAHKQHTANDDIIPSDEAALHSYLLWLSWRPPDERFVPSRPAWNHRRFCGRLSQGCATMRKDAQRCATMRNDAQGCAGMRNAMGNVRIAQQRGSLARYCFLSLRGR
jgi:hypothetical protein